MHKVQAHEAEKHYIIRNISAEENMNTCSQSRCEWDNSDLYYYIELAIFQNYCPYILWLLGPPHSTMVISCPCLHWCWNQMQEKCFIVQVQNGQSFSYKAMAGRAERSTDWRQLVHIKLQIVKLRTYDGNKIFSHEVG